MAGELRNGLIDGKPAKARQFYNPRLAGLAWNQRNASSLRKEYKSSVAVGKTTLEIPV